MDIIVVVLVIAFCIIGWIMDFNSFKYYDKKIKELESIIRAIESEFNGEKEN